MLALLRYDPLILPFTIYISSVMIPNHNLQRETIKVSPIDILPGDLVGNKKVMSVSINVAHALVVFQDGTRTHCEFRHRVEIKRLRSKGDLSWTQSASAALRFQLAEAGAKFKMVCEMQTILESRHGHHLMIMAPLTTPSALRARCSDDMWEVYEETSPDTFESSPTRYRTLEDLLCSLRASQTIA